MRRCRDGPTVGGVHLGRPRSTSVVARRCRPLLVFLGFCSFADTTAAASPQRPGRRGEEVGGGAVGGGGGARRPGVPPRHCRRRGGRPPLRRARCKGAGGRRCRHGRRSGRASPPLSPLAPPSAPLFTPSPPPPAGRIGPAATGRGQPLLGTRALGRDDPPHPPIPLFPQGKKGGGEGRQAGSGRGGVQGGRGCTAAAHGAGHQRVVAGVAGEARCGRWRACAGGASGRARLDRDRRWKGAGGVARAPAQ